VNRYWSTVHGSSKQILAALELDVWTQRNTPGRIAFQGHHEIDLNSTPTNEEKKYVLDFASAERGSSNAPIRSAQIDDGANTTLICR
jgi:hypothetical protein